MLARKCIARLVGVDDGIGLGQLGARQMVIGDEHLHAVGPGGAHARDARDAVVDGDNQVGILLRRERDDLRRKPVTVLEAVRYQIAHVFRAHLRERAHHYRTTGGAVGIEIGDDQDAAPLPQGLVEQCHGAIHPPQQHRWQQAFQGAIELGGGADLARAVNAPQHRMQLRGQLILRCRLRPAAENPIRRLHV